MLDASFGGMLQKNQIFYQKYNIDLVSKLLYCVRLRLLQIGKSHENQPVIISVYFFEGTNCILIF